MSESILQMVAGLLNRRIQCPALQLVIEVIPLDGAAARANVILVGLHLAPFDAHWIDAS